MPTHRRDQVRAFVVGGPGQAGIVSTGLVLWLGAEAMQQLHLYVVGDGGGRTVYPVHLESQSRLQ